MDRQRYITIGKNIIIRFILPILTCLIFIYIKKTTSSEILSSPFRFALLLPVIHTAVGGMSSGFFTTFLVLGSINFALFEPFNTFKIFLNSENDNLTLISLMFQSIIIVYVIGTLVVNRKKLKDVTLNLNNSTDRLRNILNSVSTAIIIANPEGIVIEANNTYSDLFPFNWKMLENKTIFRISPWKDNESARSNLRNAFKRVSLTNPIKYEEEIPLGNDVVMFAEVNLVEIYQGNSSNIVVSVRDRTDRKLYEDELIKSREIFTKLIDSNVIGMNISTVNGEIVETNDAFLKMIGSNGDEFLKSGINWKEITPPEYQELDTQKIHQASTEGYFNLYEKEFIGKNGKLVPVMISGLLIDKESILCLIVDLTLQKEVQKKKDEFISIASHELKTPTTIIKGYLQLLAQKFEDSKDSKYNFLKIVDFQINKLTKLVNELHDAAKIDSNKLKIAQDRVNMAELLENAITAVSPFIETQKIEFKNLADNADVLGDVVRLEQVVINLLTNAIKYAPGTDRIIVTLSSTESEVRVDVQDFGSGIPPEKLRHLFEKFFQVDQDRELREGLGLGLYISNEIIKKHNGSMSVKSDLSKGSTFSFVIPALKVNSKFTNDL
jgi:PAS domain S-box-containing protein